MIRILLKLIALAAIAAVVHPAIGNAHTIVGGATCSRADFSAAAFPPNSTVRIDVAVTHGPGEHDQDFSRTIIGTVNGSGAFFTLWQIHGAATVEAWAEWTASDGAGPSRRVLATFVQCPPAPPAVAPPAGETPAPVQTVPETTPAPVTPAPPVVVIPRRADKPPKVDKRSCRWLIAHRAGPRAFARAGHYYLCRAPRPRRVSTVAVAGERRPVVVVPTANPPGLDHGLVIGTGAMTRLQPGPAKTALIVLLRREPGAQRNRVVSARRFTIARNQPFVSTRVTGVCRPGRAGDYFVAVVVGARVDNSSAVSPARRLACR